MNIERVDIYPVKRANEISLKANAVINFDNEFIVKVRVIEGKKGLFVAMPSHSDNNGEYFDDCYPITSEMRSYINDTVIEEYNNKIAKTSHKKTSRK